MGIRFRGFLVGINLFPVVRGRTQPSTGCVYVCIYIEIVMGEEGGRALGPGPSDYSGTCCELSTMLKVMLTKYAFSCMYRQNKLLR